MAKQPEFPVLGRRRVASWGGLNQPLRRHHSDGHAKSIVLAMTAAPAHDVVVGRLTVDGDGYRRGQVWHEAGRIVAVHSGELPDEVRDGVRVLDVGESLVLPGAVDAHVHSLSHAGEGVVASTSAAAAGGVTTIVEMPFDGPGPINSVPRLRAKQDLVTDEAVIDVALLGTLEPGGGFRRAGDLVAEGAVGFKVSLFLTDPRRFPRIDDLELISVMREAAQVGTTICTHAENNEIIKGLLAEAAPEHSTDPRTHVRTRPPVSETLGVLTALEVAATEGASLHVCHLSLPRSVDLVRWYQFQGADVTLEVCPHYLVFTEQDMLTQRGRLKINPPLRTAADRDGLWERIAAGVVNVISSDHAPWPVELKDHDVVLDNHSGVPGVETLVPVTLGAAWARGADAFDAAVRALTLGPAQRYGIAHRKGSLDVGKDADLVVFDPEGDGVIDGSALHSNAGWSPYDGFRPGGAITHTISRGRLAWSRDGGLVAKPGDGEIITRT